MTREEAVEKLELMRQKVDEETYRALILAIKALSQEPCDDAISRDAVDKYIARLLSGYLYDGERERLEIFSAYLWELPSVTQSITRDIEKSNFSQEQYLLDTDSAYQIGYEQGHKDAEQKSGKWIAVSEMLPEDGTYLVTVERMCGTPSVNIMSFAKNLYSVDEYDFHNKKGKSGWYDYDSEYGYWEDEKVTAWMPLPKPYEPQESEDV